MSYIQSLLYRPWLVCRPETRPAKNAVVAASSPAFTAGHSSASTSKQVFQEAAAEEPHVFRQASAQLAEQKQLATGQDTAVIQLAEQLRSPQSRQLGGSEVDSARTDGVHLHGQDSAAEGLASVAQVIVSHHNPAGQALT